LRIENFFTALKWDNELHNISEILHSQIHFQFPNITPYDILVAIYSIQMFLITKKVQEENILITTDMHIHSHFSIDSASSIMDCCESAITKKIKRICITDHVELNPEINKKEGNYFYDVEAYFDSIKQARDTYGDKLTILSGVEIGGGPHYYPLEYEKYLQLPYDFIMCSVHDWYDSMFASQMAVHPMPLEESFGYYWDEVYKSVCYGRFDALAHIDFPKRYYLQAVYEWDKISAILDVMIEKGIALEINTSSIRKGMDEPMPSKELLDFYKKRGGKYITLGSDAHYAEDIAADFGIFDTPLIEGLIPVWYQGRERKV